MRHHLPRGAAPRPEKPAGEQDEPRFVVDAAEGRGAKSIDDAIAVLLQARTTAAIVVYFAIRGEKVQTELPWRGGGELCFAERRERRSNGGPVGKNQRAGSREKEREGK